MLSLIPTARVFVPASAAPMDDEFIILDEWGKPEEQGERHILPPDEVVIARDADTGEIVGYIWTPKGCCE
jgi:hypothetical protein